MSVCVGFMDASQFYLCNCVGIFVCMCLIVCVCVYCATLATSILLIQTDTHTHTHTHTHIHALTYLQYIPSSQILRAHTHTHTYIHTTMSRFGKRNREKEGLNKITKTKFLIFPQFFFVEKLSFRKAKNKA